MQTKVLHPRHKLPYFRSAGWELQWIETAREIIELEYERNYQNLDVTEDPDTVAEREKRKKVRRTAPFLSSQLTLYKGFGYC